MFTFFARRPFISALVIIVPTIVSLFYISNIKNDPSFDRLLIKNDPEKITYEKITEEFGDDNSILVYFEGPNILKRENLIKIRDFVWKAEEVEEVQQVDSLFTTPHFIGKDGVLSTTAALEDIPEAQEDIDNIVNSTITNPLITSRLIAKDKSSIVVNIRVDDSKRHLKDIAVIFDKLISEIGFKPKEIFQTGTPAIDHFIFDEMGNSQKTLLPIVVLSIAFFIFLGTGSLSASIIPIIVVTIGLCWTGAFMVLIGVPIQLLISTVPAMIFILTTTEIVHIMTAFLEDQSKGQSKKVAIKNAFNEVGLPISLTALTTTVGFGAIYVNEIIMLKEFGIVSSFALASSFLLTIAYTPLHLTFFARALKKKKEKKELEVFRKLANLFNRVRKKKSLILLSLLLYIGLTSFGSLKVVADNDSINLIKPTAQPRKDLGIFETHFGGINSVYVVLESKAENFKDPVHLKLLFDLEKQLNNFEEFYDAESFGGLMAHINDQMKKSTTGMAEYQTPASKQLVSQYLLSLTRDDYEKYVSADFKKANLTIRHSISSSTKQKEAMNKLRAHLEKILKDWLIEFTVSARSILNQRAGDTIIRSQTYTILIMVSVIVLIISILFKSFKMGLAAIPPNLLPIMGLFGTMGFLGIPLNIGSCIVAAVTVGIAVDDTIHFFSRFKENLVKTDDADKAIEQTLHEEAAPIIITSISLAIGFSFLLMSKMVPLNQFGLLSTVVILLAMVADLIITPTVLSLMNHKKPR